MTKFNQSIKEMMTLIKYFEGTISLPSSNMIKTALGVAGNLEEGGDEFACAGSSRGRGEMYSRSMWKRRMSSMLGEEEEVGRRRRRGTVRQVRDYSGRD